MLFEDLVGQREVKNLLDTSRGNLSHAYIFNGPEGIGKFTFAKALAKFLLCENRDSSPCGSCKSCNLYKADVSPDFMLIDKDKKTGISIDSIRALQRHIIVRPVYSKYKVYVIHNGDDLTEEAQNCLLKTLEEPPENAILILTTSNIMSLKETIRSRVTRIDFKRYSNEEMLEILKKHGVESELITEFLLNAADGIPGRAIQLVENSEIEEIRDKLFDLLIGCRKKPSAYIDVYHFLEEKRSDIDIILNMIQGFLRDLMMTNVGVESSVLLNTDKKDNILIEAKKWRLQSLLNAINHVEECRNALASNANFSNTVQVLALNIQEECLS